MAMYDINSIEELIDALGGDTVLASELGISQPGVGNWKVRGFIPPGWHMRLFAELRKRGQTMNPEVFGMTEDEFGPLAETDRPVTPFRASA